MGNVTVSAKSKFLVVALENVAMLHSPKVLWNWITLQSLLKQSFYAVALENVALLHRGDIQEDTSSWLRFC